MSTLEDRYRRLLALYPAAHREAHEQEMLDLLLSAARPGQTRPSLADTADLLRGAARIRRRHATSGISASPWTDALAITGFLATLLLVAEAARFAVNIPQLAQLSADRGPMLEYGLIYDFGTGPYWLAWTVIAVLAWRGLRRPAGVAACAVTAVHTVLAAYGTALPHDPGASVGASLAGVPLPLALLATASLLASPGPRHGARLLGRARVTAAVALTGVLVALNSLPFFTLAYQGDLGKPNAPSSMISAFPRIWDLLGFAAVVASAVLAAVALARTREGRRAFVLLSPAAAPFVMPFTIFSTSAGDAVTLPNLLAKYLIGFAVTMLCVRLAELPSRNRAAREHIPA
ncbi:hypothetical protein [Actinomadura verrucosospora]|uniref:Uncharacterized protein n=1 Tax=Actinomadura verrucosospora TaxID=46165 RepID=A0A7D4A7L0_ACTVE|nr:hypothetical protein [Actinomadura verrucosospora]QKG23087.1 hypothetical protein ACTIVE_4728 [Actinomadura verrucosospora]